MDVRMDTVYPNNLFKVVVLHHIVSLFSTKHFLNLSPDVNSLFLRQFYQLNTK